LQTLDKQLAGGIGIQAAGVTDGQHGNIQGHEMCLGLVVHGRLPVMGDNARRYSTGPLSETRMPIPAPLPSCSVLLLAGGRGQRMGGADKGLLEWQGRPLIAWLHDLVRPLSDDLIISCNRNSERYAAF